MPSMKRSPGTTNAAHWVSYYVACSTSWIMPPRSPVMDMGLCNWSEIRISYLAGAFGGAAAAGAMLLPRALLFSSPLGLVGGLFSAVVEGPALRVTLPCVIHITMLREFHRHGNPFK